jgi:predicted ABC-class ATPase
LVLDDCSHYKIVFPMAWNVSLAQRLQSLEGVSYGAYREIEGRHDGDKFALWCDRAQRDPFARPSSMRVIVPQTQAQFPEELFNSSVRSIALRDYLHRQFAILAWKLSERMGSGGSGQIRIANPGQAILERSAVWIDHQTVEVRFEVGLPANGRRIAGREAATLLCEVLPKLVEQALFYQNLDATAIARHVATAEDTEALRSQLADHNLVAFIGQDAVLPRTSGIDDKPLQQAARLQVPESLAITLDRPNYGSIKGLGIPPGITLIVGGGYHGKSTLLRAIEQGIYNHIPGDGREWVVSDPSAFKIRAEDGRNVQSLDISPFINHLPQAQSTTQFCTENASGSTSQAANLIEAVAAGSQVLLMDEDSCATNFLIRDRRMQALIAKSQEPITPLIDRIEQLRDDQGVSTILVMGGCGDYLDVADTVIAMQDYQPLDYTQAAQQVVQQFPTGRSLESPIDWPELSDRKLHWQFDSKRDFPKVKVPDLGVLLIDRLEVDLRALSQLIEPGQLQTIGAILVEGAGAKAENLGEICDRLMALVEHPGFGGFGNYPTGQYVAVRSLELAAAINRLRNLRSVGLWR